MSGTRQPDRDRLPTTEVEPSTARPHDEPRPGQTLVERYRLENEVGRGGMGIVFRGTDLRLKRPVAIKVLLSVATPDGSGARRFVREARAAAALSHPHVVAVHDVDEHEGRPFLVMELIEGASLHARRPTDVGSIVDLVVQVAEALRHVHSKGLVHRDLKPENVLVTEQEGRTVAKIVDLGLAVTRKSDRITAKGAIVGTVSYMAPELLLGRSVDARTDLYAVGVMLFELLVGRLPFTGDPLAVMSQHLHAPVVRPSTYRRDLPRHLDETVVRLLAKSRRKRFQSAAELIEALRSGDGEPMVVASPPTVGGLARGRLVGRDSEIEALRDRWRRAVGGDGGLVAVLGEPGAGKTRLVRELADYVRLKHGEVLGGGLYEYEATTPYLPFVEGLQSWVASTTDEILTAMVGDGGAELARLAPELGRRLGPFEARAQMPGHEERRLLFDRVGELFLRLARSDGLLVVLDDLQWADHGTLDMLRYVSRRLDEQPVLFVVVSRDTELTPGHPSLALLDDLHRERRLTRTLVTRLGETPTHQMIAALLGDERVPSGLAQRIHEETDGNPFFVEEVVKTLVESGELERHDDRWRHRESSSWTLPDSVRDAVSRRLERVSSKSRDVLALCAVLGKTFTVDELGAVGPDEDELLDALDELLTAQLVVEVRSERLQFSHDKIREVVIAGLNPIRRRRLHRTVAEGLERLSERGGVVSPADLARHFALAGDHERALAFSVAAAELAERVFAHDEAVARYDDALAAATALGRAEEALRLEGRIASVYEAKGELVAAARYLTNLVERTTDLGAAIDIRIKIASLYVHSGDGRGRELLLETQALDAEMTAVQRARLLAVEARYSHLDGQSERAIEMYRQSLDVLEEVADAQEYSNVASFLAGSLQHLARYDESDAVAEKCLQAGRSAGDLQAECLGYEFLAENAVMRGRHREAIRLAEEERARASRIRAGDRIGWANFSFGFACIQAGRPRQAVEIFEEVLSEAERLELPRLLAFGRIGLVQANADLGRFETSSRLAEIVMREVEDLGYLYHRVEGRRAVAYERARRGAFEDAPVLVADWRQLLEGVDERSNPVWGAPSFAELLVGCGQFEEAHQLLAWHRELARYAGAEYYELVGWGVTGRLDLAVGRLPEALEALDRAAAGLEAVGARLELGRALETRGRVHDRLGDADEAETDLAGATALFDECGAAGDLARLTGY